MDTYQIDFDEFPIDEDHFKDEQINLFINTLIQEKQPNGQVGAGYLSVLGCTFLKQNNHAVIVRTGPLGPTLFGSPSSVVTIPKRLLSGVGKANRVADVPLGTRIIS